LDVQAKVCRKVSAVLPAEWKLVSPGMAPSSTGFDSNGIRKMSPEDYLERFWPQAGHVFDYCAVHPYGRMTDRNESWSTIGQLPEIRAITKRNLWLTEYNGVSDPFVSDAQIAQWVQETLPYFAFLDDGRYNYVTEVFMYTMSQAFSDPYHFGMLNGTSSSATARPVLQVVKDWIAAHQDVDRIIESKDNAATPF
jgi:hypothetical protein